MSRYEEDERKIDEMFELSSAIMRQYDLLTDTELLCGIGSKEYETVVRNITIASELDDELKAALYKDTKLAIRFRDGVFARGDTRNVGIMSNDYVLTDQIYYSAKSNDYDLLNDYGRVLCDKETFLEREYYPSVRTLKMKGALTTLHQKTYIRILDDEIARTEDPVMKRALIDEKNSTLMLNPQLESWYFFLFKRDEALCVEDDETIAKAIGVDIKAYKRFKTKFFEEQVDEIEDRLVEKDSDARRPEKLLINKLKLISALAHLDADAVSKKYNDFYSNIFSGDVNNKDVQAAMVDNGYSEYNEYLKRLAMK